MRVNVIGAGLAGLSATRTLVKNNMKVNLISYQTSERAQSVLAEGGINAAMDVSGESDSYEYHYKDTLKSGCDIANEQAVKNFAKASPDILRELVAIGVPFNSKNGQIVQRYFGGQEKKRTAYAKSSTGKEIMTALIDSVRQYEVEGTVNRLSHHEFVSVKMDISCKGVYVRDTFTKKTEYYEGPVIFATGGLSGLLPGVTTGSTMNTGNAAAELFSKGVVFSNLEMVQYHPTTMSIVGKRLLVSEAARGEGGRLYIKTKSGEIKYYMEEKYPKLGNLMPRDVVARESYLVVHDDNNEPIVYLDMRHLSKEIWKNRLSDLREEIMHYKGTDPAKTPIQVEPGIHYFMGGIDVDVNHKSNIEGIYAAGECCSQYHGANRLGGNSTMGALYGGRVAALSVVADFGEKCKKQEYAMKKTDSEIKDGERIPESIEHTPVITENAKGIFMESMGIIREGDSIQKGINRLRELQQDKRCNEMDIKRLRLMMAMLESAFYRKESRGAHYRTDYPKRNDESYKGLVKSKCDKVGKITISI